MTITKEIDAIKGLSAAAAADGQRTREGFAAFTKLANERMNNIHAALADDHVVLTEAVRGIKLMAANNDLEYNAITYMARNLARFVVVHDAIQQLEQAFYQVAEAFSMPS